MGTYSTTTVHPATTWEIATPAYSSTADDISPAETFAYAVIAKSQHVEYYSDPAATMEEYASFVAEAIGLYYEPDTRQALSDPLESGHTMEDMSSSTPHAQPNKASRVKLFHSSEPILAMQKSAFQWTQDQVQIWYAPQGRQTAVTCSKPSITTSHRSSYESTTAMPPTTYGIKKYPTI